MSVSVDVIGDIEGFLEEETERTVEAAQDEVEATTKAVQNTARDNAPEVTGALVDSYQHKMALDRLEGHVFSALSYARRIEFGFQDEDSLGRSYSQPGQYPLTRAYDTETKGMTRRIKRRL